MLLQKLLFPRQNICLEEKLYYQSTDNVMGYDFDNLLLNCPVGTVIDFGTYFNSFSIDKWKKYTFISNLTLELTLKGEFFIEIYSINKNNFDLVKRKYYSKKISIPKKGNVSFPISLRDMHGILGFSLTAASENSIVYGGGYITDVEFSYLNPVKIVLNICTFKREDYIRNNMKSFIEYTNKFEDLKNNFKVYIVDNGQTLKSSLFDNSLVKIFPNKNFGGAGGFTRGLIEGLERKNDEKFTHIIMMDDDITLDPEILLRTFIFLQTIKGEYKSYFVGGAMLQQDFPYLQYENGARWNNGYDIQSLKKFFDLRAQEALCQNEREEYPQFNGWWYCCMPLDSLSLNNLPLPIFIRWDDAEYGIRNNKPFITLNGLCVWHEPLFDKNLTVREYYDVRNTFITRAIHQPGFNLKMIQKDLLSDLKRNILRYRYKYAMLNIRAVGDFLDGIEFLIKTDAEKLHNEIRQLGYTQIPSNEFPFPMNYDAYYQSFNWVENKKSKIIRLLTLNGLIRKPKYNKIVSASQCRPINFYRANTVINYDMSDDRGFITYKSLSELIEVLKAYLKVKKRIKKEGTHICAEYKEHFHKITTAEFWHKYLEF